ncbi:hypothetical protein ACH5Y9_18360 [Methylomonas sp. BW4-1]|uniref:hypothetical protein n=1 Tax=Methylomonas sp. BW4-1 TaxID=3376685 RepID=UPI00404276C9
MPHVGGGAGKPLLPTLDKSFGAQDQSGIRAAFSLDTFFWRSKRKYLGRRAETRLKNIRRDRDTNYSRPALPINSPPTKSLIHILAMPNFYDLDD